MKTSNFLMLILFIATGVTAQTHHPKLHFSATNDSHYAWYDGKVTAGSSDHLDSKMSPIDYKVAKGKTLDDVICISSNEEMHFAWYKDGTVSAGSRVSPTLIDLANKRLPYKFVLAPGKKISDVLCISSNSKMHFAWYKDGTVSSGKSENLATERSPYRFVLASDKSMSDVICISSNDKMHFAFYKDGTVSSGVSSNLASVRKPYTFRLGFNKDLDEIL